MSTSLAFDQITADPTAWPRLALDQERVEDFVELYEAGGLAALPPLGVIERRDDYLLADGWHRREALKRLGIAEVHVELVAANGRDGVEVAYEIGLRTAATVSKALTRAEKQDAVLRLTLIGGRTDQEIADLAGVARTSVGRIRRRDSAMHTDVAEPAYRRLTPPDEAAVRLFRALEKVWDARGLGIGDAVFGDRTAARLATALRAAFGEQAPERARRYRTWIDAAIVDLDDTSTGE